MLFFLPSCGTPKTRCHIFNSGDTSLYARVLYWSDNRLLALSREKKIFKSISDYNGEEEIVYKGDFPIYFQLQKDTLYIYGYGVENNFVPPYLHQNASIKIKQINISNYDNINLMSNKEYIKPIDFSFCP